MATGCQTDSSSDDELLTMTEEHIDNIQSCRSKLVDKMVPGEVLDYLLTNKVLSPRNVEKIKGKQRPDCDVNEDLVSAILKQSEKAYRVFVEALTNTRQGHLAKLIIKKKVDFKSSPPTNSSQDLTDQPDLKVKLPSATESQSLYDAHKHEAYPMHKKPRGSVCIINVKKIVGRDEPRWGTDVDRNNLERLFKDLHFEVTVYNDVDGLQAKAICVKLQEFAALPGHDQAQCAVICLLSHGGDGYILGTDDKKVSTTDISDYFNNANCPALMDKPKLFLFQACRGVTKDVGVDKDDDAQPTRGDMFFGFPTTAGYVSLRDSKTGSWYMSALVKVFSERAWNTDISAMMIEIRNLLANNVSPEGHKQCSEDVSRLKKIFYFFMGVSR